MTRNQPTSRKPLATPLAMSTAQEPSASATSTPIPSHPSASPLPIHVKPNDDDPSPASASGSSRPHPKPHFTLPKLRFRIDDVTHAGAALFLQHVDLTAFLADAVHTVVNTLYPSSTRSQDIPPVRSVTFVVRSADGVAYTTGLELDNDHKEIHFSLDYIADLKDSSAARQRDEIHGVVVHEMVHVWQWNGQNSAPGGLIEGIADFVRLRAGLSPPHWKKEYDGGWDRGYQHTGYFLDWIERKYGAGKVEAINLALKERQYEEDAFWPDVVGHSVHDLWKHYCKENDRGGSEETDRPETTAS